MKDKISIIISCALLCVLLTSGQSPNKNFLSKKLIYLRDSSTLLPSEKLHELLSFEDGIRNSSSWNDSTHAFLLRMIGALYFQLGDYLMAAKYIHLSINIIETNASNPSININRLAASYYWLSRCYDSLSMPVEKLSALDSCASIAIRLKTIDRASLWALYARIEYSFDVGDYERSIYYASICEMFGNEYSKSGGEQTYNVGNGYALSSLEWNVTALITLKKYEHAEELLANRVNEYKRSGLKEYLGIAYEQLAKVEVHKENYSKALFYFNQATAAERKLGNENRCRTLLSDIGYEIYFKHFHDPDKALFYYRKASYHINKKDNLSLLDSMESLNILNYIADAYVQKDSYDSAFLYFQLAFDQIKPEISETGILFSKSEDFARYPKIYYITNLFIDKGDAYRKKYKRTKQKSDLKEAIRIYKLTDRLLDRIKTEQFDLRSKLFWRSDSHRLYEHAIEACYFQNDTEDAFYFFEKSRAVLLSDQLKEQNWLGADDIHLQTRIKKTILLLEKEAFKLDKGSARFQELQRELYMNRQKLDGLIQVAKTRSPLNYQSILDSSTITVQEVRKNILNDHQAFMELFVGDSAVYSLIITSNEIQFAKINKNYFDSLTRLFTLSISNLALQNGNFYRFEQISSQLYKLIFRENILPNGRIVISPDGLYFPFEALITNIHPFTYFIKDHYISYTYSARFLLNRFVTSKNADTNVFLGVAPVKYPSPFNLATLNGSDQSLERIKSYFKNANNLVARDASKNNFLQLFSRYQIIQLYTHASETSNNGEPVIYFSDSTLYLSDIFGEDKPVTRIIVLSACETGTGMLYRGEGVFSLNRAFASLGIPSSISNLWTLDNVSTYKLTELFYKYLAAGLPTDIALQKAKLEFIENSTKANKLPYFWAGTILVGKSYSVEGSKWYYGKITSTILIAFVLSVTLWYIKYSLKRKVRNSESVNIG
jgi:CHAT domain-containing protein